MWAEFEPSSTTAPFFFRAQALVPRSSQPFRNNLPRLFGCLWPTLFQSSWDKTYLALWADKGGFRPRRRTSANISASIKSVVITSWPLDRASESLRLKKKKRLVVWSFSWDQANEPRPRFLAKTHILILSLFVTVSMRKSFGEHNNLKGEIYEKRRCGNASCRNYTCWLFKYAKDSGPRNGIRGGPECGTNCRLESCLKIRYL